MIEAGTRVLLIDNHCMFVEALRIALANLGSVEIVGTSASMEEGMRLAAATRPEAVVCDAELAGAGGRLLAEQLRQISQEIPVCLLTSAVTNTLLDSAVHAQVRGVLLKTAPIHELVTAIQTIVRGNVYFSGAVCGELTIDANGQIARRRPSPIAQLSALQVDVLRHLASGLSVKEIARLMNVSAKAVDSHKYRLMKSLDIHDRVLLSRFAQQNGLIVDDPAPFRGPRGSQSAESNSDS